MTSLFKRADYLYDGEKADADVDIRLPPNSRNPHSSMLPLQCSKPWLTQKFGPENFFFSESDNALKMDSYVRPDNRSNTIKQ